MKIKLKALGLGLLAAIAASAVVAMNAGANGSGGHFVASVAHTTIKGAEGGTHTLHLINHGFNESRLIGCAQPKYEATIANATENSISIIPSYVTCTTTGSTENVTVDVNGCSYKFTVTAATTDNTEQQIHIECPAGKAIVVTHPNCEITVAPQTINNAVTYTKKEEPVGTDYVTMDIDAQFATQFHKGACVLLGTNHTATLTGSVTVKAFATEGAQVGLTAT